MENEVVNQNYNLTIDFDQRRCDRRGSE